MDDARHPSSSSSSSSGLLTPLVSPRPVLPSATDDNGWKVIGSPPRKLVLSPPDDRKGPSPKASPEDREPLSLSVPRQNTDIASKSNHAPIAALSHDPDLLLTPTTPSPQALAVYATSPSRLDLLPDPPALGSRRRSFGLLDINSNIHQQPYNVGLASNHGANLESPLSLSSFLWNGRVDENAANPAQSALGMTAAVRQDTVTGGSNIFSMSAALHAHPFVPSGGRTVRSLSLSEPLGFHAYTTGSNSSKPSVFGHGEGDGLELYRVQLPTMEEEPEDALEHPRVSRARSYSTSAAFSPGSFYGSLSSSTYSSTEPQSTFVSSSTISDSLNPLDNQDQHPFLNRKFSVGSTWPHISHHSTDGRSGISSTHRRSITSSTYVPPIWESPSSNLPSQQPAMDREQAERQRVSRRFSLAPSSGFQTYDHFLESEHYNASSLSGGNRNAMDNDYVHPQRRHSVAGPTGSYLRPNTTPLGLASSLESLQLSDVEPANNWSLNEEYEHDEQQNGPPSGTNDLGKGVNLNQLSHHGSLYVVEFKAGRSDVFYVADGSGISLKCGDLVMVEADRGKDLGKITNDSITPQQIQALQKEQAEAAATGTQEGQRAPKEIHPKRIFRLAQPSEIAQLVNKSQDESKAMAVCQTKVRQKKLPMEVVDAEYQWDRRKLTFYFRAEHRIDFRELVRDLFKIYKTRIWMYAVSPSMGVAASRETGVQSSPPHMMPSPSVSPSSPQPRHLLAHHQLHHQHQNHQHSSRQALHHPSQYPQHPLHAGPYQQEPQLQDLMRQMHTQYFSAPQQTHYHGFHRDPHPLDEEPLHRPFYEQSYPLQPPHPLM